MFTPSNETNLPRHGRKPALFGGLSAVLSRPSLDGSRRGIARPSDCYGTLRSDGADGTDGVPRRDSVWAGAGHLAASFAVLMRARIAALMWSGREGQAACTAANWSSISLLSGAEAPSCAPSGATPLSSGMWDGLSIRWLRVRIPSA